MAKRFTDTDKWKDAWFTELEPSMKIFWIYLCDTCDHAGIWRVNFRVASSIIGSLFDKQSTLKALGSRVEVLTEEKWLLSKFIPFQYPKGLSPKNSAHRGVLKLLKDNHIDYSPFIAPSEELPSPCIGAQDKVKDMVKDKVSINSSIDIYDPHKFLIQSAQQKPVSILVAGASKGNATVDQVIELYNATLAGVGRLKSCPGLGSVAVKELLNTFSRLPTMDQWSELFALVKASGTLTGLSRTVFLGTLDWLVVEDNALKVLSGKYDIPSDAEAKERSNDDYVMSIKLEGA